MITPFITFVIFADSIDDPSLLISVNSIRQQTAMCWELEIRVLSFPDIDTLSFITHDNPRIKVLQLYDDKKKSEYNSTVISLLPKGVELFPNACMEIQKAFDTRDIGIVSVNIISTSKTEGNGTIGKSQFFISIIASRIHIFSDVASFVGEITVPLGIVRDEVFATATLERSKNNTALKDFEIKSDYLAHLESEILILQSQLQQVITKADFAGELSQNLITKGLEIDSARAQIAAIHRSRTWKIGLTILSPIRCFRRFSQIFSDLNNGFWNEPIPHTVVVSFEVHRPRRHHTCLPTSRFAFVLLIARTSNHFDFSQLPKCSLYPPSKLELSTSLAIL